MCHAAFDECQDENILNIDSDPGARRKDIAPLGLARSRLGVPGLVYR
jgi:hypothetical protein